MADDNCKARIYKSERLINESGVEMQVKEMVVAGENLKECKRVFDEEWSKK